MMLDSLTGSSCLKNTKEVFSQALMEPESTGGGKKQRIRAESGFFDPDGSFTAVKHVLSFIASHHFSTCHSAQQFPQPLTAFHLIYLEPYTNPRDDRRGGNGPARGPFARPELVTDLMQHCAITASLPQLKHAARHNADQQIPASGAVRKPKRVYHCVHRRPCPRIQDPR